MLNQYIKNIKNILFNILILFCVKPNLIRLFFIIVYHIFFIRDGDLMDADHSTNGEPIPLYLNTAYKASVKF